MNLLLIGTQWVRFLQVTIILIPVVYVNRQIDLLHQKRHLKSRRVRTCAQVHQSLRELELTCHGTPGYIIQIEPLQRRW
jgi:hypothetical protein